jgi:phenol hydroxylase P5 protein
VVAIDDCATDIRKLFIELDREIAFNPGQYVQLAVPGSNATRSYSLANRPSASRQIELHVRRTPAGLASDGWIFKSLSAGDKVALSGPYGRFFFREAREEPVILVAGGTGLAPIKSMILDVLDRGLDRKMILYQGARTADTLYDYELFRQLESEHPGLRYRPCLSESEADGYETGLVTDVLDHELPTCRGYVGYVCGPPPMVDAALKTFMKKRLFPRDIYREDFYDESDRLSGGVRSPLLKR